MQTPLHFAIDNRLPEILERVRQLFPGRREAVVTSPLDQLIYGVVAKDLSPAGALASYRRLRSGFPRLVALRDAQPSELQTYLVGVPAAALKAAAIPDLLRRVDDAFGSLSLDGLDRLDSEMARRFLLRLPQVTDDVAASVLTLTGRDRAVLSVDQDTARPLRRLALGERGSPLSALPRQLIERAPAEWRSAEFTDLSRGLARVADRWCHQGKPDCRSCPLASVCPSAQETSHDERKVVAFPSRFVQHREQ
ncbi:MAG: hypothetical protein AAF511_03105 [Pseudomonadota bacterium]